MTQNDSEFSNLLRATCLHPFSRPLWVCEPSALSWVVKCSTPTELSIPWAWGGCGNFWLWYCKTKYRHTLFNCTSIYYASQMCFYNLKATPSTSKKIMTHFIVRLTVLWWSGTDPTSPRHACSQNIGEADEWRQAVSKLQRKAEWSEKKVGVCKAPEGCAREELCPPVLIRTRDSSWSPGSNMSLIVPHPLLSDTAPPITLSREQLYENPELPDPSSFAGPGLGMWANGRLWRWDEEFMLRI